MCYRFLYTLFLRLSPVLLQCNALSVCALDHLHMIFIVLLWIGQNISDKLNIRVVKITNLMRIYQLLPITEETHPLSGLRQQDHKHMYTNVNTILTLDQPTMVNAVMISNKPIRIYYGDFNNTLVQGFCCFSKLFLMVVKISS